MLSRSINIFEQKPGGGQGYTLHQQFILFCEQDILRLCLTIARILSLNTQFTCGFYLWRLPVVFNNVLNNYRENIRFLTNKKVFKMFFIIIEKNIRFLTNKKRRIEIPNVLKPKTQLVFDIFVACVLVFQRF
jgi:hypothetical protein